MTKKIIILLFLSYGFLFAQSNARGLFMAVSIGPRVPVSDFSQSRNVGVGIDFALSYTDISFLPVFLYTRAGFQHFPGKQDFYKVSDYSAISTNVYSIHPGARLYLEPLLEELVMLMPVIDLGFAVNYIQTFNSFKADLNRPSYTDNKINFGFHAGLGFSMFMLDAMAHYNYVPNAQFLSFDLTLRIPIFATI